MARKHHSGITEQRKASIHRFEDAQALFRAGRWRGAMYLGGYVVECRLKYKLMEAWRCVTLNELEGKLKSRGLVDSVFIHSLETLFRCSGSFERLRHNDAAWSMFANEVNEWTPAWRYSPDRASREQADDFLRAVSELVRWIDGNV